MFLYKEANKHRPQTAVGLIKNPAKMFYDLEDSLGYVCEANQTIENVCCKKIDDIIHCVEKTKLFGLKKYNFFTIYLSFERLQNIFMGDCRLLGEYLRKVIETNEKIYIQVILYFNGKDLSTSISNQESNELFEFVLEKISFLPIHGIAINGFSTVLFPGLKIITKSIQKLVLIHLICSSEKLFEVEDNLNVLENILGYSYNKYIQHVFVGEYVFSKIGEVKFRNTVLPLSLSCLNNGCVNLFSDSLDEICEKELGDIINDDGNLSIKDFVKKQYYSQCENHTANERPRVNVEIEMMKEENEFSESKRIKNEEEEEEVEENPSLNVSSIEKNDSNENDIVEKTFELEMIKSDTGDHNTDSNGFHISPIENNYEDDKKEEPTGDEKEMNEDLESSNETINVKDFLFKEKLFKDFFNLNIKEDDHDSILHINTNYGNIPAKTWKALYLYIKSKEVPFIANYYVKGLNYVNMDGATKLNAAVFKVLVDHVMDANLEDAFFYLKDEALTYMKVLHEMEALVKLKGAEQVESEYYNFRRYVFKALQEKHFEKASIDEIANASWPAISKQEIEFVKTYPKLELSSE